MKKRYTKEQIIRILKQAETGISVADLFRKHHFIGPTPIPTPIPIVRRSLVR